MDTDSFIMFIETEDFYKDISNDVKERFVLLDIIKLTKDYQLDYIKK